MFVGALLTRPHSLDAVRAQLAGVDAKDVIYIEAPQKDGIHGFTNDPETLHACVNAVKNATGSGAPEPGKGMPIYFYLKSDATGIQRRRPIWISSREDAAGELGPGMQDCLEKFDRNARVDPPGH